MAGERKLTLADFLPHDGLVTVPEDMKVVVISKGFYTCGADCPHPPSCLANEHCERGIDPGTVEVSPTVPEKQYAARDAAWQAHYAENHLKNSGHNSMVIAAIHGGFDAGWAARKKVELEIAFGLDKPKAE